jgi:hypothetical protein
MLNYPFACHEDIFPVTFGAGWKRENFEVGVDSGQAGIFDGGHYKEDKVVEGIEFENNFAEPWYNVCCDVTLADRGAGVIPFGVVSRSGFGDGGYTCYTIRNEIGWVIAVMIDFHVMESNLFFSLEEV